MELLSNRAPELGLSLDDAQLAHFESYYRDLADWNTRMNLTSVIDYAEVQVKHFLDSLTVLPALGDSFAQDTRVVDVGAGAGFPGIPLKLACPGISLALVEATAKKAGFLSHVVETLDLTGVDVYTGRAEELVHRHDLRGRLRSGPGPGPGPPAHAAGIHPALHPHGRPGGGVEARRQRTEG